MFVKLAQFLNIMLYVLVAGVMWGTWLSLGRTMTGYDASAHVADFKNSRRSGFLTPLLMSISCLSLQKPIGSTSGHLSTRREDALQRDAVIQR